MHSYSQLYYHIVFATYKRVNILNETNQKQLFKYFAGICKNKKSHLIQINAHRNHIHMLVNLHQTIAVSNFIKDIKVASSKWISSENIISFFNKWQVGAGSFTVSKSELPKIIDYIKKQKEHHKTKSFMEEWKEILDEHGIDYNEKYLFD